MHPQTVPLKSDIFYTVILLLVIATLMFCLGAAAESPQQLFLPLLMPFLWFVIGTALGLYHKRTRSYVEAFGNEGLIFILIVFCGPLSTICILKNPKDRPFFCSKQPAL